MAKRPSFLRLLLLMIVPLSSAFIAYDCSHPNVKVTQLDLTSVKSCAGTGLSRYSDPISQPVQVLQYQADNHVNATRCFVTLSRKVTKCGFNSITYGSDWPVVGEVVNIEGYQCLNMYNTKKITLDGQTFSIDTDRPFKLIYYSKGEGDTNGKGSCKTDSFKRGNVDYDGHFEETHVSLIVERIQGEVDPISQKVIFRVDLDEKLAFPVEDRIGKDDEHGTFTWTHLPTPCKQEYSLLSHANATIHRVVNSTSFIGGLAMIRADPSKGSTGGMAGLKIVAHTEVCGVPCYRTHVDSLLICPLASLDSKGVDFTFKASFDQVAVSLQTSMGFRHLDTRLLMARRHTDLHEALCEVGRREKMRTLSLLANDNQPALLTEFGPGHRLTRAGAVAWIRKCEPVEVTLARVDNCTHDIPVRRINGTTGHAHSNISWVDPLSFTFKAIPSEHACSDIMPARVKIKQQWFSLQGKGIEMTDDPQQLMADSYLPVDGSADDPSMGLGNGGIFTKEQLEAHAEYIAHMDVRPAVVDILTKKMYRRGENGVLGVGSPFDSSDAFEVGGILGTYILGPFYYVVRYFHTFVSVFVVLGFLNNVFSFGMKIIVGLKTRGAGWWMITCLVDTAFHLAVYPVRFAAPIRQEIRQVEVQEEHDRREAQEAARRSMV